MPADIAHKNNCSIENIRFYNYNDNYVNRQSGIAFLLKESYIFNEYLENRKDIQTLENNKLITLEGQILRQYNKLKEYSEEIDIEHFKSEHLKITSDILSYNPDLISSQLTNDMSIFVTFTKDKSIYHFDYYLEKSIDDEDVVLVITDDNKTTKSFAGSYHFIINKLNEIFPISNSNTSLALVLNELSN